MLIVIAVAFIIFKNRPIAKMDAAPEEKSRHYSELRERVERGEFPSVEERLPENPLVVTPAEQIGRLTKIAGITLIS